MENLDEKIDHLLERSLMKEYVKASDFRVNYAKIAQIRKAQEAKLFGLNGKLAQEFVMMLRLQAARDIAAGVAAPVPLITSQAFSPDLVLAIPNKEVIKKAMMELLNYDEDEKEYKVPAGEAGRWINDRLLEIRKFVRGQDALPLVGGGELKLDFKDFILENWDAKEEKFEERIKGQVEDLIIFARTDTTTPLSKDPESRPLSPGAGSDAGRLKILPSQLKDKEANDVYVKFVNFIKDNQSEVDQRTQEYLNLYNEHREDLIEKYKSENKQYPRTYAYSGPDSGVTRRSWNGFIEFLEELDQIGLTAQEKLWTDIRPSGIPAGVAPVLPERLIKEDQLNKIVINFEKLREQELNESFLAMFGGWVESILDSMFGGYVLPMEIQGSRREVESFAKTIAGEKSYIESAKRYGLDHPTTYKNRSKLDAAVKNFERDTGLKWPFK